jgi:protein TonB
MMRLWVQSYSRGSTVAPIVPIAAMSGVVHAVVIALWVIATLPAAQVAPDSIANRVYFIPPPDKAPGGPGTTHEVVHYLSLEGTPTGDGAPRVAGDAPPVPAENKVAVQPQRDTTLAPAPTPTPPPGNSDSVFTILDVDTAVVRSASSAAPAYPIKLLDAKITGSVLAQYIVDTTGFADTASFHVMKATNQGFVDAVREALPYMRFKPAKIGPMKVRQLVEQNFSFKINIDTAAAPGRIKKP